MISTDFGTKYATARDRVYGLLSDLGWHTWRELEAVGGVRYGARLLELRRLGYLFETADLEDGQRYRLKSLERAAPQPKRVKVLLEEADAESLYRGEVSVTAAMAVSVALASFRANRGKL